MPRSDTTFKPGQSGNKAGRRPGSKNKINSKIWDILAKWHCNPLEVLCWIATDNLYEDGKKVEITPELMSSAAKEIMQYCYPKLKSIEHKSDQAPIIFRSYSPAEGMQELIEENKALKDKLTELQKPTQGD